MEQKTSKNCNDNVCGGEEGGDAAGEGDDGVPRRKGSVRVKGASGNHRENRSDNMVEEGDNIL